MPEFPHTPYQYQVLRLALKEAYLRRKCFTRKSFAETYHLKANRHTDAALDAMADDFVLLRALIPFPDKRERLMYSRLPKSGNVEALAQIIQEMRLTAKELYEQEIAEKGYREGQS